MSITSSIVLLAVLWFLSLLILLPIRFKSQGDAGDVTPGTPASAPAQPHVKRSFILATIVSVPLWLLLMGVILSGVIGLEDFDLFHRFGPSADDPF
ncbi:hypothetical protein BV394_12230 [Brevirhabdus pacifica]|uniref:Uncharacterized protein n=1 Tax=Brevirhabdus pacifica TaxID=1267768 RepID=A0A1U7DKA3_9RHOB|nr:DUF1467 family protein [Brevirhabdus pacifica]APX90402.1 hypothetical protein BV394_12230 [Brevirhabdus pacifica]OWU78574.1 hypothetical protein ATO5_07235 [Loktanella sp. 22II-4b]PJJ85508.1 putative secreted protein [Brevirhabdus pacifica]